MCIDRSYKGKEKVGEKSKTKTKPKLKKKSTSTKTQILIDPDYSVSQAHDDTNEGKVLEEKANQVHKKRKVIPRSDWAEKLQIIPTTDNAQVGEINVEIQPVTTTNTTQFIDSIIQGTKADHSNPDKNLNSNSEGSNYDKTELTLEEKKKLLWGSRTPAPKRDSLEIINKIYNGNSRPIRDGRRGGLGLPNADTFTSNALLPREPGNMTGVGENVKLEYLQKIIYIHIVLDLFETNKTKEKMLYFLESRKRLKISQDQMRDKPWQELEYVIPLLKVINFTTARWSAYLKDLIYRKQRGMTYKSKYTPKYIDKSGNTIDMPIGGANVIMSIGVKVFTLNPDGKKVSFLELDDLSLGRSNLHDLRAAIYQNDESTEELKDIKQRMELYLNVLEENLLKKFFDDATGY
ncbi:hypothetical protein AgCh_025915 [Apium graveolens]